MRASQKRFLVLVICLVGICGTYYGIKALLSPSTTTFEKWAFRIPVGIIYIVGTALFSFKYRVIEQDDSQRSPEKALPSMPTREIDDPAWQNMATGQARHNWVSSMQRMR